jgi:uncharacterized protein YndB with AHSA1/START domain
MPASTAKSNEVSATADREIMITRIFNAPREMVFNAWTDPKHLAHWYGPNGFTTTVQQMDVRPGGHWRLVMRGPDGRDYNNHLVFSEVTRPAKLVYSHQIDPDTEPIGHTTTVTFEEKAGKTLVTLHMVFPTAEQFELVVKTYGAIEGGKQTLGKLAEYLQMDAAGKESFEDKTVVITRVFDAPRAMVFAMWTDAKHLKQWWGPKGFTNPVIELDLRIGGALRFVMRGPDGAEYPGEGKFQEITPPERLVFTNGATGADGGVVLDGWTTVTFAEQDGDKTLLTLTTRAIARIPIGKSYIAGMEQGWSQSLEKLTDLLA